MNDTAKPLWVIAITFSAAIAYMIVSQNNHVRYMKASQAESKRSREEHQKRMEDIARGSEL